MTPTQKLRWIEREELFSDGAKVYTQTLRVLQQWYTYDIDYPTIKGEWKDVPLENEA